MGLSKNTVLPIVRRVQKRFREGSAVDRLLYRSLFTSAFRREAAVVSAGHAAFARRSRAGSDEYLLRRNVHMLEKGLTMRPRRETFALEYILETVQVLRAARAVELLAPDVEDWAREVLLTYFEATRSSLEYPIKRARKEFEEFEWERASDMMSGPSSPPIGTPPVAVDQLHELARRRKSIRWYTEERVPRQAIDTALSVASESPTACNRQPFHFRIYDDPEMLQRVAEIPMGTKGYVHNLQTIAVVVGDQSAFFDERDRHLIYIDGSLAAMNFINGLESQGISTLCINWPDIESRNQKMAKLIGLKDYERVVMLVAFGYADAEGLTPHSAKKQLAQLRTYNVTRN